MGSYRFFDSEGRDERRALIDAQVEKAPRQTLLQIGGLRVAGGFRLGPVRPGRPAPRPIRARIHDGDEDQSSARGPGALEEFLYGVVSRHYLYAAGLDTSVQERPPPWTDL